MEYEKLINLLDNKPNQPNNIWKKKLGWNKGWILRNV